MNTLQPRIASSALTFPPGYAFRIPNGQPLLRSVSVSAVLRFNTCVAKPDTILASYRRLIARKFDGSKLRTSPDTVVSPAGVFRGEADNERFQIVCDAGPSGGALANLGHLVSDQTVGNILRRYGIQPAPSAARTTPGRISSPPNMAVLAATDFFTVEVLTWRGLATYYVLFFIHLDSRRVSLAGLTKHSHRRVDDTDSSQRHRRQLRIPRWDVLPSS